MTRACPKQDGSRYAELQVARLNGEPICDVCGMPKSWHAFIDGVRYTGRTQGNGMIWKGKRMAHQS